MRHEASADSRNKIIIHIITSLSVGGAESMLYKLLAHRNNTQFIPIVVCLSGTGSFVKKITDLDIPVHVLAMKRLNGHIVALYRLMRLLRRYKPAVVQCWMYHANLLGVLLKPLLARQGKLVWNIRHTPYKLNNEQWLTAKIIKWLAKLSNRPDTIIYNSAVSAEKHQSLGYAGNKMCLIGNGFDTDRFKPMPQAKIQLQQQLGLTERIVIMGHVARWHKMKDHASFLQAASILSRDRDDVHFVMLGRHIEKSNKEFYQQIQRLNLTDRVSLLGEQTDVARYLAAFDILTLSSAWGEGFPNVIGEAMSCAVPCVATDVGDCAQLLADTGCIVPVADIPALLTAWRSLIDNSELRHELSRRARDRIKTNFSINAIVTRYEQLYDELLNYSSPD